MRANLACKEGPDPEQLLLRCHPGQDAGTPFPSCTRSSFDTSPGALPGCPSTHWCTGSPPALLTPRQALRASLGSEAGVRQDQPRCSQAQMLPPSTNAVPHAQPTRARGETPRDVRGDGGDACTAGRECRPLGTAQPRQGRRSGAKPPEESFAQRLPPKG